MIALYILLGILLLLLLLLLIPVTLRVRYADRLQAVLHYLFLSVDLTAPKPKAAQEKPKKTKQKPDAAHRKKGIRIKGRTYTGFEGFVDLTALAVDAVSDLLPVVGKLLGHLIVRDLKLTMQVGGGDAADTAVRFGRTNALIHGAYAFLAGRCRMKGTEIRITPDFDSTGSTVDFACDFRMRGIFAVIALLKIAVYYGKMK